MQRRAVRVGRPHRMGPVDTVHVPSALGGPLLGKKPGRTRGSFCKNEGRRSVFLSLLLLVETPFSRKPRLAGFCCLFGGGGGGVGGISEDLARIFSGHVKDKPTGGPTLRKAGREWPAVFTVNVCTETHSEAHLCNTTPGDLGAVGRQFAGWFG